MGYQQSFVKFSDVETLKSELVKYKQRDSKHYQATVYGVVKTIKPITPFKKDELAFIVGGERYTQREAERLKDELGIENVQEIVFIDNPRYWNMSNGDIGKLLDTHFTTLTEEELEELTGRTK